MAVMPEIRLIETVDVSVLPVIESAADQLLIERFGTVMFADVTSGAARVAAADFVLVADRPCVGFAQVLDEGETAHLQQLAVDPARGRRGIGAALVEASCAEASRRGFSELTLTTFRDVSFNKPWYARLGFEIIGQPAGAVAGHLDEERALAALMPRVAMRRSLV